MQGNRLQDKVAIITGAGTKMDAPDAPAGTGQAIATRFARQGAKVLLVDLDRQNAGKTLAAIEGEGGQATLFQADVSSAADCQAMVEAALAHFGRLDVLVNNVGVHGEGAVTELDEAIWDRAMNVNLKAMALAAKYAIPKMIEGGGGTIINIASVDGLRAGVWHNVPYAVSKGGVITLTTHMAVHYGRDNIRANCIAPGMIYGAMVNDKMTPELRNLRREATPLGQEGTAWDVAWGAVFLASDEARWITGVTLPIDGGLLATTPLAMLNQREQKR